MESTKEIPTAAAAAATTSCHVVAMPYPGRGHINPMINLCKQILSIKPDILFTFVVTEEWNSFLIPYKKPTNVNFKTIPNVIPSELCRADDFPGFLQAVATKMEAPFEQVLDGLDLDVDVIVADTYLDWAVRVGNRRQIPVASFWTMSATVFSFFLHFDLLLQNGHFPIELSERGEEVVDYIPGVPPTRLLDLPAIFCGTVTQILPRALEPVSMASKAQYLLFTSAYELEASVFNALKLKFSFPVYPLGSCIPYLELEDSPGDQNDVPDYLQWLNSQPQESVLYVSMGSFLSVSSAQKDEIVAGVLDSGVRFFWVSRGETSLFKHGSGDQGLVVPWCDQLRVLCHPSIGGFWTHCGWNSTLEALFSGVPMLAAPIYWDQISNSKKIVEDWHVGWRVKQGSDHESLVTREEIAKLVKSFMDPENGEIITIRSKAKELQEAYEAAITSSGSSHTNLESFVKDISNAKAK